MLVSIYIPTKNRINMLRRSIESVLSQTYKNIELIVADDGSTDGSREYLSSMSQSGKLKYIPLPTSMGACVARNLAIAQSTGQFITGLDDDDKFTPDRIEKFVTTWKSCQAEGKKIAGIFDSVCEIRPNGKSVRRTSTYATAEDVRIKGVVGNQLFSLREYYIDSGMFDPAMPIWQDWDLWARISKKHGDLIGLNACTYIIDATHDFNRITKKPAFLVRHGAKMFMHKHGPFNISQRASILSSLSGYSQVNLTLLEIINLVVGGRYDAAGKHIIRRLIGERRYEALKFATVFKK